MLEIGTQAPEFELPSGDGESYSLAEGLKEGSILLYFYPFDFTPTCTKEACMYQDKSQSLKENGVQIWGVNARGAKSHTAFKNWLGLDFPLLIDADKKVARSYDALAPLKLYVKRISYWISPEGVILDRAGGDFSIKPHREMIDRILEKSTA